jgi:outer membrane immunogenic protein
MTTQAKLRNLLFATSFLTSAPVMAADVFEEAPPDPPEPVMEIPGPNWTGFHIGAGGGYGGSRQTGGVEIFNYDPGGLLQIGPFDLYSIGAEADLGGDGWIGTVEGGYDIQINNFVLGISGDYTWSGIEGQASIFGDVCYEAPLGGPDGDDDDCSNNVVSDRPDVTYTLETGDSWSVIGRAGFLLNPNSLLYGLGGYTHTSMNADVTLNSDPTGSVELMSYDYDRDGWTWGLGLETLFAPNWSAKIEYRNTSWSEEETVGGDPLGIRFWDEGMVQTVRGVVSYRFGAGASPYTAVSTNGDAGMVTAANWTGFHIGAGAGYGNSRNTGSIGIYDYSPGGLLQIYPIDLYSIGIEVDSGGDGAIGTVEGGYDFQIGNNFVIGVGADYTWSGIDSNAASVFGDVCYEYPITGTSGADDDCSNNVVSDTPEIAYKIDTGDSWSVIGRAGFLVNPQTLIYGLGGYTHQDMKASVKLTSDPTGSIGPDFEFDRDGWTWGAGIESMLTSNLSAKVEYRNTTWQEEWDIPFGEDAGMFLSDDTMIQSIRAVISWRL